MPYLSIHCHSTLIAPSVVSCSKNSPPIFAVASSTMSTLAVAVQLPIRRPSSQPVHQALGPLGPVPLPDTLALPPPHRTPLRTSHHRLPPGLHLLELNQPRSLLQAQPHDSLHPCPLFPRGHFYRVIEGTLSWSYDTRKISCLTRPRLFLTIHRSFASSARPAARRKAVVFYIPQ